MMQWTYRERVCELAMGREPCNEIGTEAVGELERFLEEIQASGTRALIIHSTLSKGFCAGADLRELYAGMRARPADQRLPEMSAFLDRVHRVMDTLDMLPLTTIAAVHGICFGGGFELALTCDLIVADRTARFAFPELRLGLVPGFGGIPRLKRELPNCVIRDLLLTGRSINAKRAASLGLVSQAVAPGEALAVAREAAAQAALFSAEVSATAKRFTKPLPSQELAEEKELFLRLFQRPEVEDALRRFVQSEDPMPYLPQGMAGGA